MDVAVYDSQGVSIRIPAVRPTDGGTRETREQLGGYFLIDATNLDEAIGIAARIPMAGKGTVEVRADRDRRPADGLV